MQKKPTRCVLSLVQKAISSLEDRTDASIRPTIENALLTVLVLVSLQLKMFWAIKHGI